MSNPPVELGVILVDHGSRQQAANDQLLELACSFQGLHPAWAVEPAHMELAEPTIAQAYGRCVDRGARRIIVLPYFLAPGRHWEQDIPALAAQAAAAHPGTECQVAPPIGLHPGMFQILDDRIGDTMKN